MDAQAQSPTTSKPLQVAGVLEHYRWQSHFGCQGYSPDRQQNITRVLNLLTACKTGRMGSHLYRCALCQRGLMGMDHCDDRHCVTCGQERRDAWRKEMIGWSLDCDYFHTVFTLPHDFNPLIYVNSRNLYKLIMATGKDAVIQVMQREFGCVPGITQTLHTWGQQMNLHVHTHMIVTAGGLSLDGQRWITAPPDHPAIQPEHLAAVFRKLFLLRIGHRLRRNKLVWPTRSLLPEGDCHAALGMSSHEQLLALCGPEPAAAAAAEPLEEPQTSAQPKPELSITLIPKAPRRQRDLTTQEASVLKALKLKQWMVSCMITPPDFTGPDRAISYLARYVAGVAISDGRLVSDSHGIVTISYKDYRDAETRKMLSLPGPEFLRRFAMHILPRGMARVRHSGLFNAAEREERLAKCRQLLAMAKRERSVIPRTVAGGEYDLTEECDEEGTEISKANACQCRYCGAETELVGRLRGSESLWIMNVAQQIVFQLATLLPVINEATVEELLSQVRSCWLTLRCLPAPIRALLRGQRFTSLEMTALEARLLHELRQTPLAAALGLAREPEAPSMTLTSGIPPPAAAEPVAAS